MSLMEDRIMFEHRVEQLLQGKPERYKQIIWSKIYRAMEYQDKMTEAYIGTDVVIGFMVQLDGEYVSNRQDNE